MGRRIDAVKEHLTKYKWYYISAGLVIGTAGITCLIVRGSSLAKDTGLQGGPGSELQGGSEDYGNSVVNNTTRPLLFNMFGKVSDSQNIRNEFNITTHTGAKGNPGFMTRHVESGAVFQTQKAAAEAFGIPETVLSAHLNNPKGPLMEGTFERVSVII